MKVSLSNLPVWRDKHAGKEESLKASLSNLPVWHDKHAGKEESMNINKVTAMYFSATGTTKKICETISDRLIKNIKCEKAVYDFTLKEKRMGFPDFAKDDLVVFGTPTYAGRVPNVLLKYLDTLNGNGALAIPVVLFGNRNYDDSLIELRDILEKHGFKTIAAGAFVGEHSFSKILAAGRPDDRDINEAIGFADAVYKKLSEKNCSSPIEVKGCEPIRTYYQPRDRKGNPVNILKVKPEINKELCDNCGICARVCPMSSIDPEDVFSYKGICIKCGACEKKCPKHARYYTDPGYIYHRTELELGYERRADNELFL